MVRKERIFFYNNQQYTIKEVEKVFNSFSKKGIENPIKQWSKFVKQFGKWALEDKEFIDSLENCEECGFNKPSTYKLSKLHPRYKEGLEMSKDLNPCTIVDDFIIHVTKFRLPGNQSLGDIHPINAQINSKVLKKVLPRLCLVTSSLKRECL